MAAIHRFKGEMAIAEVAPGAIWVLAMASGEAQEQLANLGACEAINEVRVTSHHVMSHRPRILATSPYLPIVIASFLPALFVFVSSWCCTL